MKFCDNKAHRLMKTDLLPTLKRKAAVITSSVTDFKISKGLDNKLAVVEAIRCGERAVAQGRVLTHKSAKKRMSKWFK